MSSIGFPELIVILLVALIVFGPKRLPEVGRSIGKGMREFRRATTELKDEFERDLDEEPTNRAPSGVGPPPGQDGAEPSDDQVPAVPPPKAE